MRVRVLESDDGCATLPLLEGPGVAKAVVWPGVGARVRSLHRIVLEPGSSTVRMRHEMEAVYFVRAGTATLLDEDLAVRQAVPAGAMIFVEPGTAYRALAEDGVVELVGGPCPPDPALYEHLSRP